MKVYVAGKFEDRQRVAEIMNALRGKGFQISLDWTGESVAGLSVQAANEKETEVAALDLVGVAKADALALVGHPNLKGAWVEMGAALALGIPVVILNPEKLDTCIFSHLCEQVPNEAELVLALQRIRGHQLMNLWVSLRTRED